MGPVSNSRANPHALSCFSFRINALGVFEGHSPDIWQSESQKESSFLRGNRAIFDPIKINPLKRKRIYRAIFGSTGPKMARSPTRTRIRTSLRYEKSPEGHAAFRAFCAGTLAAYSRRPRSSPHFKQTSPALVRPPRIRPRRELDTPQHFRKLRCPQHGELLVRSHHRAGVLQHVPHCNQTVRIRTDIAVAADCRRNRPE